MKMTKKKVFVAALAISLVAIVSMGTLAWFSDSKEVTNNFLIAESDDDTKEDIFSIDLWENTPDGDEDRDGQEYEDILPGSLLEKDVIVKNTGYYDQYVRVIVTISDAAAWLQALPTGMTAEEAAEYIFDGLDLDKWDHIYNNLSESNGVIPENLIYVLYYHDTLEEGEEINVFDNIKIPEEMDQEQAARFDNEFTITVKAQAVQTENVVPATITAGKTAAWEAFNTVGMSIAD